MEIESSSRTKSSGADQGSVRTNYSPREKSRSPTRIALAGGLLKLPQDPVDELSEVNLEGEDPLDERSIPSSGLVVGE
jgi:hypothetical protein